MPLAGFEPANPEISLLQTYALDCSANWTGDNIILVWH